MPETAVGLFEQSTSADAVVVALRQSGIPSSGIRVVTRPMSMPVNSATSTPSVDFAAGLAEDLSCMGATKQDCEAYLAGLRSGNTMIFATGTQAQADTAVGIMNTYNPVEVQEYAGAVPSLPAAHYGDAGEPNISSKVDHSREKSEGARVFSW